MALEMYRRMCGMVIADGHVDDAEKTELVKMKREFNISPEDHKRIWNEEVQKFKARAKKA